MLKNLTRACLLAVLYFIPAVARAQSSMIGSSSDDAILKLIVSLVVAVVIFFIIRELVCWYWKLNEIVNNLKEINISLRDLRQEVSSSSKVSSASL